MLSSLLGPTRGSRKGSRNEHSPFASPFASPLAERVLTVGARRTSDAARRRVAAGYNSDDLLEEEDEEGQDEEDDDEGDAEEQNEAPSEESVSTSDEDGDNDATPLLPIFSAVHLDALPVYNLTHTIRLLVVSRCETTLSWDQLRSPQVSQFLLKPIQQEVRTNHFSAATEYALLANCLQFMKEAVLYPGHSGTSRTRAMVCELLAIKLLREHSSRDLIDSLSYDFDPLQGQITDSGQGLNATDAPRPNWQTHRKPQPHSARISCLEIAIRAQAKRFLAHPMVVQQLEAIWAGTIVFHSAADSMHRKKMVPNQNRGYGTTDAGPRLNASQDVLQPAKQREHAADVEVTMRRAVTLYNPRDASLFKLSRLRVPRYRNLLSTCSFAVLLALFLAVLIQRSLEITTLEVFFWFWAAGYMLDEIVGVNEQGFSLYIASFWNTFDLGILLILFAHLCLRIYGIVMPDVRKRTVANMAYDVLAADAILLFPRLFSVLDHYRYFSQLLIAFRMMAADLMAVFVLILISCSGFFVALTLSFGNDGVDTPGAVAYALLQMLMGFTPAAWDRWDGYNALGKTILTLFLFICHFLVVTILITVLTNSFMAIVQNANEEHQFVFAVNTISMVKSDALFSYVAPTNIFQWLLTPLRFFIPFRQYVKVNRTAIKITHFPILFSIYLYERIVLQTAVVDTMDVVEPRGRSKRLFKPKSSRLAREPSVATFRQDRALEEVFRKPFDSTMRNTQQSRERRKRSNVVSNWMRNMDEVVASSPPEQDRKTVDRLESRFARRPSRMVSRVRDFTRSIASDPEDFIGNPEFLSPELRPLSTHDTTPSHVATHSEIMKEDGPDVCAKDDHDDVKAMLTHASSKSDVHHSPGAPQEDQPPDYFPQQGAPKRRSPESLSLSPPTPRPRVPPHIRSANVSGRATPVPADISRRPIHHLRNVSSATVVYKPISDSADDDPVREGKRSPPKAIPQYKGHLTAPGSGTQTPSSKPTSSGHKTPRKGYPLPARMRPNMPSKDNVGFQSAPNLAGLLMMTNRGADAERKSRASLEIDLVSDIGDNKAIGGGYVGAIPASFVSQMAQAAVASRGVHQKDKEKDTERDLFGRLMMARMNSLEEGFREVVHEMRENLRREKSGSRSRSQSGERAARPPLHRHQTKKVKETEKKTGTHVDGGKPSTDNKENQRPRSAEEALPKSDSEE